MDSEIQVIHDVFARVLNSHGIECILVRQFILHNPKTRMTVRVMSFGASILSIQAPDNNGKVKEVVAGFDTYEEYRDQRNTYIGATIGRIAGGIRGAHFVLSINNKEHKLTRNFIGHHWNGGFCGLDKRHWDIYRTFENGVCFGYCSPAWEEGYPNKVYFKAIYKLTDNTLDVTYLATFVEPSVINMTNHTYFNLAGHDAGPEALLDHYVTIKADDILETYKKLPTGNSYSVECTEFDLREGDILRHRIEEVGGFDHYWTNNRHLNRSILAPMARIIHKKSGRILTVFSNQPAMHFYTATDLPADDRKAKTRAIIGRSNTKYLPNSLFCAMPQGFPDAPHNPNFPSIELQAFDTYRHRILYEFCTLKKQTPLRVIEDLPGYDYLIDPKWTFAKFDDENVERHGFDQHLTSAPLSSGEIPPNDMLEYQYPRAIGNQRISVISEEDSSSGTLVTSEENSLSGSSASIPTPQEVITITTTCRDRPPDEMAPKPPIVEPPPRPPKTEEIKVINTEVVRTPSEGPLIVRYSERGTSNEPPVPEASKATERMESEEVPTTSQSLRPSAYTTWRDSDASPPIPPKRIRILSEPKDESQNKQQVQTTKYTGTIPKTSAGRVQYSEYDTVYGGKVLRETEDSVDTIASRFMATTISKDYSNRYKSPEERSNIPRSISETGPISARPEAMETMRTQGPLIPSLIPMHTTTADELPTTSAATMQATRMAEFPTTSGQETAVTNVRGELENTNIPQPCSERIPLTHASAGRKDSVRFHPISKSLIMDKWKNIRKKISQREQTQSSLNTKETRNYNRLTRKSTGSETTVRTNTRRSPKKKTDSSSPYKRMSEPSPSDSVDTVVRTNIRTSPKKKFSPVKLVNKAVKKFRFSKSSSASTSQSYNLFQPSESLDVLLQEDTRPRESEDTTTSDYGNENEISPQKNEDKSESEIEDKK